MYFILAQSLKDQIISDLKWFIRYLRPRKLHQNFNSFTYNKKFKITITFFNFYTVNTNQFQLNAIIISSLYLFPNEISSIKKIVLACHFTTLLAAVRSLHHTRRPTYFRPIITRTRMRVRKINNNINNYKIIFWKPIS